MLAGGQSADPSPLPHTVTIECSSHQPELEPAPWRSSAYLAVLPPEVAQLQKTINTLQTNRQSDEEAFHKLETDLHRAQIEIDWLTDQTPACKYREYGQRLKDSCEQGRCDPGTTNSALNKLKELPGSYVVLRLKPELGAGS